MRALSNQACVITDGTGVDRPFRASEDRAIERALRILESRAVASGELLSDRAHVRAFFSAASGERGA